MLTHGAVAADYLYVQTQMGIAYNCSRVNFSIALVGIAGMAALTERQKQRIEDLQPSLAGLVHQSKKRVSQALLDLFGCQFHDPRLRFLSLLPTVLNVPAARTGKRGDKSGHTAFGQTGTTQSTPPLMPGKQHIE
ncbi:hypothetical protein JQK88_29975 [Mesorhizobium caraganae]|uniref:hypothetical protein n=1 Tax=Mesorhizobium caraganae TaxID=483206 RepID=UPI00193AD2A9|nr:hypothetical protein [Mesorhizobium caraganae]MBM2715359.1 hypothetical protein [Mesorhizobium caraganae]